jgi:hypothetical protein
VGVQFSREVAVYDYDKCLDILIQRDGMDIEGAIDYMEYNVVGAYVGNSTPVFVIRDADRQEKEKQDEQSKQITIQLELFK